MENQQIIVAIKCLVYNHKSYIRQCLDGFIMQKTNFHFVAIVHDDASTDGTADIIRDYEKNYPEIIKPIYETENQYSKKDGSLDRIMREAINSTGCKYIAICEGDDYWIDSLKLQKQVEFLDAHKDYSMCFTGACVISDNEILSTDLYENLETREYTGEEIISDWIVPTASVVYRKNVEDYVPYDKRFCVGDNVLFLSCAKAGRICCINSKSVIYRRSINGWTGISLQNSILGYMKWINHYTALLDYFPMFSQPIRNCIINKYALLALYSAKRLKFSFITTMFNGFCFGKFAFFKELYKIIKRRMLA